MTTEKFTTQKIRELFSVLAPATNETSSNPAKACAAFNGRYAFADDDHARVEVDFPTELKFAAPLRPMRGLLGTVTSDTVEITHEQKTGTAGTIFIRDGNRKKDRMEIPCLEDDRVPKEIKLSDKDDRVYVNQMFAKALDEIKANADLDGNHPERKGVHLEFTKDTVRLGTYSDGLFWLMSLDAYSNPTRNRFTADEHSAILMPWVASTLATLLKATEKTIATLTFHQEYLHFSIAAGDKMPAVRMLCNPLHAVDKHEKEPFDSVYEKVVKAFKPGKFFPIPEHLNNAVERANALMSSSDLSKDFHLDVLDGGFRLQKKTAFGESDISFPAAHGCTPYAGLLRHDKVQTILPHVTEMTFSKDGAVFFKGINTRAFLSVPRKD